MPPKESQGSCVSIVPLPSSNNQVQCDESKPRCLPCTRSDREASPLKFFLIASVMAAMQCVASSSEANPATTTTGASLSPQVGVIHRERHRRGQGQSTVLRTSPLWRPQNISASRGAPNIVLRRPKAFVPLTDAPDFWVCTAAPQQQPYYEQAAEANKGSRLSTYPGFL